MRSEHSREVLDWFQVTDLDSGYLDQLILMNEEPVKKVDTAFQKCEFAIQFFLRLEGFPHGCCKSLSPKPNYHKQCCPSLKYFQEQHPGC